MINREILYERNMTGSYMKIPVNMEGEFDEKILLRKRIRGLLPMERAFVDGSAQYWYNISGKQSLDTYCRMRELSIEIIENLILSICDQLEILEWNLVDTKCLMLDPELIFISSDCKEFIFMVYPGAQGDVSKEIRQLMDFILTKVNHKDMDTVQCVYGLYERLLDDEATIFDIREAIVKKKKTLIAPEMTVEKPVEKIFKNQESEGIQKSEKCQKELLRFELLTKRIKEIIDSFKNIIKTQIPNHQKPVANMVYPTEVEEKKVVDYPTVLLSAGMRDARGMLVYEGVDGLGNIVLEKKETHIGKGQNVDVNIDRDTISHFHARIEVENENYYIQDMNSKNGTFVNHQMIAYKERHLLKKNDLISFADVEYRFC